MTYWHDYTLRHPMREIASRYPKTYKKVGDQLREMGLTGDGKRPISKELLLKQWIATLAAMPPHVQPYRDMLGGNTRTWGEQDWTPIFDEIFRALGVKLDEIFEVSSSIEKKWEDRIKSDVEKTEASND